MWIRSAFWIGAVRPGAEAAFKTAINDELIVALKKLPGVDNAIALWPQRFEAGAPKIVCQILVEFGSQAEIDRMLASPERTQFRTRVLEVVEMFDGTFSHIDYEVA